LTADNANHKVAIITRALAPAARTLGVHINTLYQRIAVLDRLLGPDWRQPPDRWTCTFYYESFQIPTRA
jgi:PucR C-terminal helix-turn-helix domain